MGEDGGGDECEVAPLLLELQKLAQELIFLAVGLRLTLLISTVVSNLLQQGFARALLSTVLTFLIVDLFQAFALLPRSGSTAILPMLHLFARETALSCLLIVPVYPALRAIRRIFPD